MLEVSGLLPVLVALVVVAVLVVVQGLADCVAPTDLALRGVALAQRAAPIEVALAAAAVVAVVEAVAVVVDHGNKNARDAGG